MVPISGGATQPSAPVAEAGAPTPALTEDTAGREPDAGSETAIAAIERHDIKRREETALMRLAFSHDRRESRFTTLLLIERHSPNE